MSAQSFFSSSIGRKVVMALSGLALSLFLLLHLVGNLVILADHAKFNDYAHKLADLGPLLWAAEVGLVAVFLLHIVWALKVTLHNRAARPHPYHVVQKSGRSQRRWYSSRMALTGTLILIFIIKHLLDFKWGEMKTITQGGMVVRDLASLVVEEFTELDEVIFYTIALLAIGFHLRHGFRSLFETLGIHSKRSEKCLVRLSHLFVYGVVGGFIVIPWALYWGIFS